MSEGRDAEGRTAGGAPPSAVQDGAGSGAPDRPPAAKVRVRFAPSPEASPLEWLEDTLMLAPPDE